MLYFKKALTDYALELSRASDQNVPTAEYILGYLYMLGQGVPQDFHKAMYLLMKSRDSGYDKSGMLINTISAALLRYYEDGLSPEIQTAIKKIKKSKR